MRNRVASVTAGLVTANGPVSRTRMCVVFLTVCLATAVGVLVGGPSVAFAASCSSGTVGSGYTTSGTPLNGALPAVGQTVSAGVEQVSSNANNNNGVQVHGGITLVSGSDTIGVGIRSMGDGLGPEWYAEKDNNTISSSVTFEGTFQPFSIKRTSTTGYTLYAGGDSFNVTVTAPGSNHASEFWAYSKQSPNGTCPTMNYYLRNLSPWNTNGMNEFDDGPGVKTISTTEFEVTQ